MLRAGWRPSFEDDDGGVEGLRVQRLSLGTVVYKRFLDIPILLLVRLFNKQPGKVLFACHGRYRMVVRRLGNGFHGFVRLRVVPVLLYSFSRICFACAG